MDFVLGSSWKGASQGSTSERELSHAPFPCAVSVALWIVHFLPHSGTASATTPTPSSSARSLVARRWQLWVQVPSSPQPAETLHPNFSSSSPCTVTSGQSSGLPLLGRVLRNTRAAVHRGASSSQALGSGLCQKLGASALQDSQLELPCSDGRGSGGHENSGTADLCLPDSEDKETNAEIPSSAIGVSPVCTAPLEPSLVLDGFAEDVLLSSVKKKKKMVLWVNLWQEVSFSFRNKEAEHLSLGSVKILDDELSYIAKIELYCVAYEYSLRK